MISVECRDEGVLETKACLVHGEMVPAIHHMISWAVNLQVFPAKATLLVMPCFQISLVWTIPRPGA